jgi:hypothetical protein
MKQLELPLIYQRDDDHQFSVKKQVWPVSLDELKTIEFFPDYCSTSIWIRLKDNISYGVQQHVGASWEDLDIDFPLWFQSKVDSLQNMFDIFADSGSMEERYGFSFDDEDNFILKCIKVIEHDFCKLFPDYAHILLPYRD